MPSARAPTPLVVRLTLEPVTPPESVRLPASEFRREAPPRVTKPEIVFVPEILRMTPVVAETPVPVTVSASGEVMPPCTSKAAPLATTVAPAAVPRALFAWMLMTPA